MERREFIGKSLTAGAFLGAAATDASGSQVQVTASQAQQPSDVAKQASPVGDAPQVVIERAGGGRPHAGKVLASIAPHSDDHSLLAGGTIAKLIAEGYTGYLIRTSNDEMDSYDLSLGETIAANERDNQEMARVLGIKQVFDLGYRNHALDDVPRGELRARLIFLLRLLKVDTILTYDPWGHYEENPDHYVTSQCVEAACWMAAGHLDFPEHFAAGLKPHMVTERYYYARGPQQVNRVVDISSTIDTKLAAACANKTMIGNMVRTLRDDLARRKLKLPALEGDNESAIRAFVELRFRQAATERGKPYGLTYAEQFHYIGPNEALEAYVARNAVPL